MKAPIVRSATLVSALLLAACVHQPSDTVADDPGSSSTRADSGARSVQSVEVRGSGGFAPMETVERIERGNPSRWLTVRRQMMVSQPLDSAAGSLAAPLADRAWRAAAAARADTLRADYGPCANCADVPAFTVTIVDAAGRHVIKGDGVTLPPALRSVMDTVTAIIRQARGSR